MELSSQIYKSRELLDYHSSSVGFGNVRAKDGRGGVSTTYLRKGLSPYWGCFIKKVCLRFQR